MSKEVFVVERAQFLGELARVAIDAHDEMFEDAEEMLNAFRTILNKHALPDPIVFEGEVEEDTRSGATTCDTERCIYLPDQLQESADFKLNYKLQVIVAKLPEKPKEEP